ncbi:MAG: hypothetical protein Q7J67_06910 [bacterium]|nr:hypothetical protein [bacterium]
MNSEIEKVRDYFIEIAGSMAENLGLNSIAGQMYALLYISNDQVSLDEITHVLKVSKGNVSVNIRVLERWGAVKKAWVKGSRRNFYKANEDILEIITNRLKEGLTKRTREVDDGLSGAEEMLQSAGKQLNKEDKKVTHVYKQKIADIRKLSAKVKGLLKFLP